MKILLRNMEEMKIGGKKIKSSFAKLKYAYI